MPCSSRIRAALLCSMIMLAAASHGAEKLPELNARLTGTRWTLQTLDGATQAAVAGGTPVQLQLSAKPPRLAGHTGCNRLMGRYVHRGTLLTITPLGTTRMACAEPQMKQEQAVLAMLAKVDGYRIENQTLSLLQGEAVRSTWKSAAAP